MARVVARAVIGILALQGDVREHELALGACGQKTRRVRSARDLDGVDALVIPGGESTTIGKLAKDLGLFGPIVDRIRAGMPTYGSCAGMIMLADDVVDGITGQTGFGGIDMTVRRNAFGRQVDSFEADVDVPAVGETPIHAVFIRAPWAERVGPGVQVLATVRGPDGADRIVAVRQGHSLATAFHPELTGDLRVHQLFADIVREATEGTA